MDDDGDHAISYNEFAKAMRDYKIQLSEPELRAIYADFDEDGDGIVSIDEFIRELRVKYPIHIIIKTSLFKGRNG